MTQVIQPIKIVQSDYGYQIPFTLTDGNGSPVNLTGATLALKAQDAQDPTSTLLTQTGVMAVDSSVAGTCHFTPASGDFPNPGVFLASITATYSTEVLTWTGIQIIVVPALPQLNN